EIDYAKALYWYTKATREGYPQANFKLGEMFYEGKGVKTDLAKARDLFEKAAEQGHAGAQFYLGQMYLTGKGVPKDMKKAKRWMQEAYMNGNQDAKRVMDAYGWEVVIRKEILPGYEESNSG
ncbi:tetratricopeptide repeat protein, partial [Hydrogenimonas sp.]